MMLLLLKVFGVRRVAGWALQLARVVFSLIFLFAIGAMLYWLRETRLRMLIVTSISVVIAGSQVLWRRRRPKILAPEIPQGERTIDGKRVPDKLAMAAFAIPSYSSDGEAVLRGLPDYGKMLLKLDAGEFAYVPELPGHEPKLLELPVEKSAVNRTWPRVQRWAVSAAIFVLVIVLVAGGGIAVDRYRVSREQRQSPATIQDKPQQPNPPPLAAAQTNPQRAPEQTKPVEPRAASQAPATLRVPSTVYEAAPDVSAPAAVPAPSKAPTRDTYSPAASTALAEVKESAPYYSPPASEPSAVNSPVQPRSLSAPASINLCIQFQGIRSCNLLRREGSLLVGKWPNGDVSHMEIEHFNATDIILDDSDVIASNRQTVHMVYKAVVQGNLMTRGTIFFANNPIGTWTADWEP